MAKDAVRIPSCVNDLGEYLTAASDNLREASGNAVTAYTSLIAGTVHSSLSDANGSRDCRRWRHHIQVASDSEWCRGIGSQWIRIVPRP